MARVHDSIDIAASCDVVFRQLTAFEEYPRFMAGVKEVTRRDARLYWRAQTSGREEQWEAEIIENIAPSRLTWRARGHEAVITCRETPWGKARIFFEVDQEPLLPAADPRHYLEAALRRTRADLENLREWVERRAMQDAAGQSGRRERLPSSPPDLSFEEGGDLL